MKKLSCACLVSLFCALWCSAASVEPEQAARAVGNWLREKPQLGCRLGTAVAGVRTCLTADGTPFHVVQVGGGFVVTSSDSETEPIIAFSESGNLVEDETSPLWVLLNRDLSSRQVKAKRMQAAKGGALSMAAMSHAARKWSRLLPTAATNGLVRTVQASSGRTTVSDVRVTPLLKTKWSQQQDAYYSNRGSPCYNYYTPENYPCGCVATATAQIMRYFSFPTDPVTPGTYNCQIMTGRDWINAYSYYPVYETSVLTMQGGQYNWNQMPAVPADGTTLVQRQAIGKLTSDVGIACLMAYGPDGSSAGAYMAAKALTERFQYASATAFAGSRLPMSTLLPAVLPNLNAKSPVLLGLDGYGGGHAVVADGYGYSMETLYLHVNMGHAGNEDAWYAPPDFGDYSAVDIVVCNVFPQGPTKSIVCSGRLLSAATGVPLAKAIVTASGGGATYETATDANGIYAFVLTAGNYQIVSSGALLNVSLAENVGSEVTDDGYYYVRDISVGNRYDCDLVVSVDPTPVDPTPVDPTPVDPTPVDPTPTEHMPSLIGGDLSSIDVDSFAATTYDGYLCNATDGTVVGTIQVKAAKPKMDKKTGRTTTVLTVSVQLVAETKKISAKGNYDLGLEEEQTFVVKNRGDLVLRLGADGLVGSFEGYAIEAVPNVFAAKDAASKTRASAADAAYVGTYNLMADEGLFTVTVAKKGKVKITGTAAAGKSVSVSTQLLIGQGVACVPTMVPKAGLAFTVWFGDEIRVDGLTEAVLGRAGALSAGSVLTFDVAALAELVGDDTYAAYFPDGISVEQSGKKWIVADGAKAGKVVLTKDKSGVDETKLGDNPSGLKFTYTEKTGTFKGSFKAYADNKGQPKAVTVNVSGVLVGGRGYGTATVKKAGIPVTIGPEE